MKTCKIDTEKITSFKITNNIFFSANSAFLFCTDYEIEMMIKKNRKINYGKYTTIFHMMKMERQR